MFMVVMMAIMKMMMMDYRGVTLQTLNAHIDVTEEWSLLECNAVPCVQYHCLPKGVQGQAVQLAQHHFPEDVNPGAPHWHNWTGSTARFGVAVTLLYLVMGTPISNTVMSPTIETKTFYDFLQSL